ncbi:Mitochondrial glycoprotein [Fagus crenata]
MALTSILRKSASSLVPLAGRLVRCQRNYDSALFTAITHTNVSHTLGSLVPNLHYSSASKRPCCDQTLLRVIESEIQCLQETDDHDRIEVEVHMPDLVTGENGDDHDGDDGCEKASQSCLPLVVSVSKKGAPSLEFSCISYPDQIEIESLACFYVFFSSDLDEDLQKAFNRYLKMRGIKPSTINFLHEYMISKNSKEELIWMKKLKKFIEA